MSLSANYCLKFVRNRKFFTWLIALFIVYVIVNQILLNWIFKFNENTRVEDENAANAPGQLLQIKERLKDLQKSLDRSHKNANELKLLMQQAQQNIKGFNVTNDFARSENTDKIAVLVFSCNRPDTVSSHLTQLIEHRKTSGKVEKFPIIVSQDCGHLNTEATILKHSANLFKFIKVN